LLTLFKLFGLAWLGSSGFQRLYVRGGMRFRLQIV